MTQKGIVVSPPFKAIPNGVQVGGVPSAMDIRKYLLYWDEIDYPDNNALSIGLSQELKFLQSSGVLKRTRINFQGSFTIDGTVFIAAQEQAFKHNEAKEKGKWSLAQISDTTFYNHAKPEMGVEFELIQCLPVPKAEVELGDILEFKRTRASELAALRAHLDEMQHSIIAAGDIPRAKTAAISQLAQSLQNLDKVLAESGIDKVTTSLRGTIAEAVDSAHQAGEAAYAIDAAGVASASFVIKPMLQPHATGAAHPLTYIKSIRDNLGS